MNLQKIKLYITELLLFIFLFLVLFEFRTVPRIVLALVFILFLIVFKYLLKKRLTVSIYNNQLIYLSILFGIIYILIFYASGIKFGFYNSIYIFSFKSLYKFIIPTIVIIYCSEVIRFILLSQKNKKNNIFVFIMFVMIDLILYTQSLDISVFDDFMSIVGFTMFSSIAFNFYYNYVSMKFGYKSVIMFRIITSIYMYIIPVIPNVHIFIRCVFRMIIPYVLYLILEFSYSKKVRDNSYYNKTGRVVTISILTIIMIIIVGLVSCEFKYGTLVVGSGSMAGTFEKGDVTLFERYDGQNIKIGDVIIFNNNNSQIIHRVIKKEIVNNNYRFYTKGDANEGVDKWIVNVNDIVGISRVRLRYIGFPTIWIHDAFN